MGFLPDREQELPYNVIFIMRSWEQQVFELPAEEKIKLIRALWESVEQEVLNEQYPVSEDVIIEMQKRYDEYLRDGERGETWEVVKARILAKLEKEYGETERLYGHPPTRNS